MRRAVSLSGQASRRRSDRRQPGVAIRTVWPQRRVVSDLLLAALGEPTRDDLDEIVVEPQQLKKAAVWARST